MSAAPHPFGIARLGAGLAVADAADEIARAIAGGAAVVTAPPGTGKTTLVPPIVANLVAERAGGRVLVTQPRRVAVRAAARRIAELDGSRAGERVGFAVRGERRASDGTAIEIVTPGVLLRRLLADPGLDGVAAVVLDEVHERSVDGDLLLGMLAEVRQLRDDLVLVAMSATLDAGAVAELIGQPAPVVDVPSALHPLSLAYVPGVAPRLDARGVTPAFLDHVARTALAEREAADADALVFLPGAREVDEVVRRIRGLDPEGSVDVLPLHGRLPAEDQDRATSGRADDTSPPRIVVSTALAESSLTVPGVRLVVDAGLAREVRRDQMREITGLVTASASRASVEQRSGRAARQGPGRAVRLFSEADLAAFPKAAGPEIQAADLTDAALLLAAWGTPGGEGLPLLTRPPAAAMGSAVSALRALRLVDGAGHPTDLGRRVARMPVGAREARALLAAAGEGIDPRLAAEVIAALSGDAREPGADLSRLLRDLREGRGPASRRWRSEARRLAALVHGEGPSAPRGDPTAVVTALARPEWIARRVSSGGRTYLLASGTRAALPETSALVGSDWLAVHEMQRVEGRAADGTGAVIRLAAPLSEDDALRVGSPLESSAREARIDDGRLRVREERRLGAIVLSSTPVSPRPEDAGPAFAAHLRERGLAALAWSEQATALRARLALLRREIGEPWPDVRDDALLADLDAWLGPDIDALRPGASLASLDPATALRRLLPWPEAIRLDELAPEHLPVPSGSRVRIAYPDPSDPDARPVVPVKLQEVFGLAETPRIAGGRVPVLFHLLSPARRPLAVTDDLASFWNGPYREVRKEMRGRYPRHPWPEDPWTAPATARTTRGMRRE
ncbi:ATP-dependent helicase HrpB [Microbacterium sp. gxy059]|uniref:ATP-dependent helicase HrpB n=1 Tax=Microbacterium sp. gxy059 TaxID=2957199 RepID=UPI003D9893FD